MITWEQLEAEVRRLAAERPAYRYPKYSPGGVCYYQTEGKERCIFGEALGNLGVEVPAAMENSGASSVLAALGVVETPYDHQADWADRVQDSQDAGIRWADAVSAADEAAR